MALDHIPFEQIIDADLQRLIDDGVAENRSIEYKRDAIGHGNDDKKEFLKDVSALANASGGHIVLGMEEKVGLPAKLVGVNVPDMGREIQRLDNLVRDSIDPRLVGIQLRPVTQAAGNPLVLIGVTRSWNPPHRVTYQGWNKFFVRNSNGAHEMTVQELRSQFLSAATLKEWINEFRQKRTNVLRDERATRLDEPRGTLVVHLIPLSTFSDESVIDVVGADGRYQEFSPLGNRQQNYGGSSTRPNFDGLLYYSGETKTGAHYGYTQLYRNGVIEAACGGCLHGEENPNVVPYRLRIHGIEASIVSDLPWLCRGVASLGLGPPAVVLITLVNVSMTDILVRPGTKSSHQQTEPVLPLPAITLDTLDLTGNWQQRLRPAFDAMWNAYHRAKSPNFRDDGTWAAPQ